MAPDVGTLGYSEEGGVVTLRMTRADYLRLTLAIGVAAGTMSTTESHLFEALAMANRLNAGNPQWTPYTIPDRETVPR